MALTLEQIRNTRTPIVHTENGHTLAVIDVENYRHLAPLDRKAYREALLADPFVKSTEGLPEKINSVLDRVFDENYQTAIYNDNLLLIDPKSPRNFMGIATDPDIYQFTLSHEMAHGFYKLKEAGADYMGAVEALVRDPAARADLQNIIDERVYIYLRDNETNFADNGVYRHGLESVDAVKAALRLPAGELEKLAKMPAEERRLRISGDAQTYDNLTDLHDCMHPDIVPAERVHRYFSDIVGDAMQGRYDMEKTRPLVMNALAKAPFEPGSAEHDIIRSAQDSAPRVMDSLDRKWKAENAEAEAAERLRIEEGSRKLREMNGLPPLDRSEPAAPPPAVPLKP